MVNQISVFDRAAFQLEEGFVMGDAKDIEAAMQAIRAVSVPVAAVAGLVGCVFAHAAFCGATCTLGFSLILLAPAALCAAVAFDAYKVMRCCSIVINEAMHRSGIAHSITRTVVDIGAYLIAGKPVWMLAVEDEVKRSALLWITCVIR